MTLPSTRAAFLACLLLLAAPATARADFFVIPFAGIKFGGSTSIVDLELAADKNKLVLGGTALKIGQGFLGYEVEFGTMPSYFENDEEAAVGPLVKAGSYVSDLTASLVLSFPPSFTRGGLRPYAVIGGGLIHAESEDFLEVFQVRRTVPAINLGFGATGLVTNNVGVRFDLRHLRSLSRESPSGGVGRHIDYWRFTMGLLLRP
jgi:hypothetical protein